MIRPIRKRDIARCAAWYNWYIEHTTATFEEKPLSAEVFSERVDEVTRSYPWLILETDGATVGYAYLDRFNPKSAYRFTADVTVYLDPEKTGRGYGRVLLEALEAEAYQIGLHKLISIITSDNLASRHLHEALGYRLAAEISHAGYKHKQWLSVCWYEKNLRTAEGTPKEPDLSGREVS